MIETIKVRFELDIKPTWSISNSSQNQDYNIEFGFAQFKDAESGQMYGLEKFWAFMKYYKHAAELHVDRKLQELLEPFKTIEDFKIYYSVSRIWSICL